MNTYDMLPDDDPDKLDMRRQVGLIERRELAAEDAAQEEAIAIHMGKDLTRYQSYITLEYAVRAAFQGSPNLSLLVDAARNARRQEWERGN